MSNNEAPGRLHRKRLENIAEIFCPNTESARDMANAAAYIAELETRLDSAERMLNQVGEAKRRCVVELEAAEAERDALQKTLDAHHEHSLYCGVCGWTAEHE